MKIIREIKKIYLCSDCPYLEEIYKNYGLTYRGWKCKKLNKIIFDIPEEVFLNKEEKNKDIILNYMCATVENILKVFKIEIPIDCPLEDDKNEK